MRSLLLTLFAGILLFATSCKDDEDSRSIEPAKIVGVKINGVLYIQDKTPDSEAEFHVVIPQGINLSEVKTQLLISNGELTNFANDTEHDLRKPVQLVIKGKDGKQYETKLIVQSPPLFAALTVEGIYIPKEKVFFGKESVVAQIDPGTDLTALKLHFEIYNGKLLNYTEGTPKDFSTPFQLQVEGVDEATVYNYEIIFTDQPIGPAYIKNMTIDGIVSDSVVVSGSTLQPYFTYLPNYQSTNITLTVGLGTTMTNQPDMSTVNLLDGFKIKAKGTNGEDKEYTVATPKVASIPVFAKTHEELQFALNAGTSAAFSNGNVLICTHQMNVGAAQPLGIQAFALNGAFVDNLSKTGTSFDGGAVSGVRKFAVDTDGRILGVQLGAGAPAGTTLSIFRWNSITDAAPTAYISYTQASLGLTYAPRAAGINVIGSLAGNAKIVVPIAQKQDVFVWTVTGGVLNPTPAKYSFPYSGTGYYYAVEPLTDGFVGAASGSAFNGVNVLNAAMVESAKVTGVPTSDIKVLEYRGRKYAAYTTFGNSKHTFRLLDITTPNQQALTRPIMDIPSRAVNNGNNTVDADLAVVNGKLHVLFLGTNDGVKVYRLEQ